MSDNVELRVGADLQHKIPGIRVDHFLSYQISSDLYTPADAFHLELANPETEIKTGLICELYINNQRELTGIIDKVSRKVDSGGVSLSVEGRDLMGLLVDSYCESWKTVTGYTIKALAEMLLAKVPFINRKEVVYQNNVVGQLKGKKRKSGSSGLLAGSDTAQKISQIEPGMTIFDVLKNYSLSRGMLFYCEPDGTLVFGRPMAKGVPEYTLQILKSGAGNNVIEAELTDDISRRYSKVIIVGQQQGSQSTATAAGINTTAVVTDAEFPFYKPYVTQDNNDNVSPKERARLTMEKQRREGKQLIYKVDRHSQNGKNWRINSFCHIKDEVQKINGDYLIYGRTFDLSKDAGPTTTLKLGMPGLIAG